MFDLLIKHPTIIDGTGIPAFQGDIGIKNGKLSILEKNSDVESKKVINADGYYICPGFIDAHSHGDVTLGHEYAYLSKVSQGITTHIAGMCGLSLFPVHPKTIDLLRQSLGTLTNDFPDEMESFVNCKNFLEYAEKTLHPENIVFLVGHVALRIAVMGCDNRKPTPDELEQMKSLLREAMENGAAGLSTGLIYIPSAYAEEDEIVELCKVVAEYDGIYTTHMRNEAVNCFDSVNEAISVARKSGVQLQISHLKIAGVQKWGDTQRILDLIHDAQSEGIRVAADQYPYTASATHLSVCIPPKYFSNGISSVVEYLKDPKYREIIYQEMHDPETPYDNYYLNAGGWDGILISVAKETPEAEGLTVAEYAKKKQVDAFEAFCDLLIANHGVVSAIYFCISEEDLLHIAKDKDIVFGTDALPKSLTERTHPRAYGTFPRVIRHFVKEKKVLTLPEAIKKMTSQTAKLYHIEGKGIIADGYDADLVIFDYDKISDTADYINSNTLADGIEYVIVAGEIVYEDKKLTGAMPGKTIRFHK